MKIARPAGPKGKQAPGAGPMRAGKRGVIISNLTRPASRKAIDGTSPKKLACPANTGGRLEPLTASPSLPPLPRPRASRNGQWAAWRRPPPSLGPKFNSVDGCAAFSRQRQRQGEMGHFCLHPGPAPKDYDVLVVRERPER